MQITITCDDWECDNTMGYEPHNGRITSLTGALQEEQRE